MGRVPDNRSVSRPVEFRRAIAGSDEEEEEESAGDDEQREDEEGPLDDEVSNGRLDVAANSACSVIHSGLFSTCGRGVPAADSVSRHRSMQSGPMYFAAEYR